MEPVRSRQIIIAGAGIGGLTAALAFASRGYSVQLFEKSAELQEIGAGIQLSPNATRILQRLGVLRALSLSAVRPAQVRLRDAARLSDLARIPLGDAALTRWKAPYLVAHRADLQSALMATVARDPEIRVVLGATVRDIAVHRQGVTVSVEAGTTMRDVRGLLAVGADGVWSTLRGLSGLEGQSQFTGQIAWRRTIRAGNPLASSVISEAEVAAFLHPGFHLIAYPVRAGSAINLVAFTAGPEVEPGWLGTADPGALRLAMKDTASELRDLVADDAGWTRWPIHVAKSSHPWIAGASMALIGDAAHAMTPYAAQGAAMAIEDAETLAACVAAADGDLSEPLARWEVERRKRVRAVASRGAFNRFAWHAAGPVARARDFVLRLRSPKRLMADMDWLYGWEPPS